MPKPPQLRPRAGSVPLFLGVRAHDRAVQQHGRPIRIGLQGGHQARPDALVAPGGPAAIDRVPLAVLGRQLTLGGTPPCHPARRFPKKATMIFLAHAYIGTGNQKRMKAAPLGVGHRLIGHRGPSSGQRAKRGIAGKITAGAQDVQSPLHPLSNATRIWLKSHINTA